MIEKRYKISDEAHYVYSDIYEVNEPLRNDEVVDLLNEQDQTIQTQKDYITSMEHGTIFEEVKELKERNQRQYEQLKEVWGLIFDRDWEELEKKAIEIEENEKLLQKEYGDVDG